MIVAPIIHSRTFSCDFDSNFKVRPDAFLDNDIIWARKIVLQATISMDSLQGERWLVADNGKYRMAGVVGFLKNIAAQCDLNEEQKKQAETMFCDDKGRLIYSFIGVVIDTSRPFNMGTLTYDYLWNMYANIMLPIWNRTYQESILMGFQELHQGDSNIHPNIEFKTIGSQKMYESNAMFDYKLFLHYLTNDSIRNFSFCSNISDINSVKKCDFSILTTSGNVITRLSRVKVVESNTQTMITPMPEKENKTVTTVEDSDNSKKKSFVVGMICLMILVAIILIVLLLTGNSSQASQLVSTIINCQEMPVALEIVQGLF